MIFAICLVIVTVLGTSSAQTFSMGACNASLPTVANFDKTQFSGKWYQIKRGYNTFEIGMKCFNPTFLLNANGLYDVNAPYISKCPGSQMQSITFTTTDVDIDHAKWMFSPGFIDDSQPFAILGADYEKWMVAYSCVDSFKGKLEFVWIFSRNPTLDDDSLALAKKVLKDIGIKVPLITEVQDCDAS